MACAEGKMSVTLSYVICIERNILMVLTEHGKDMGRWRRGRERGEGGGQVHMI